MRTVSSAIADVEVLLGAHAGEPVMAVGLIYRALGPAQREVWDRAENEFQAAGGCGDPMLVALAADAYVELMMGLIGIAARNIQHARITAKLNEDCWMAREEG